MEGVRAQTPLYLQKALVKEIEKITSDMQFQKPQSDLLSSLHIYEQNLPIPQKMPLQSYDYETIDYQDYETEETSNQFPWCLVKISNGNIPEINGRQEVEFTLCFGIYNNVEENKGHEELLNLIQKVYERFAKDPLLDNQYTCIGSFEWALQDEDTYPYYFGAILLSFQFQGFRRENKYL